MDDFLKAEIAAQLFENFPSFEDFSRHYKGLNEHKSEGSKFDRYHPQFRELKEELSSQPFYDWLSGVTGIKDLFMTDDGLGAGLHQGKRGSFLDVHIDFNIHPKLDVHRRLNLLIYLNKDWKPEWGGAIELWNSDVSKCEKQVMCDFNRCLIFETNEISYHGYTKKLEVPEGVTRKSFYSYYYTQKREDAHAYHDTTFKATPQDSKVKVVSTTVKEKFKNSVKAGLKKIGISI